MRKLALFTTLVCLITGLAVGAYGSPPQSGPTPVTVTNSAAVPVPVFDVNTYVSEPVLITLPGARNTFAEYVVPEGKLFVIEVVNAFITTSPPTPFGVSVWTDNNGPSSVWYPNTSAVNGEYGKYSVAVTTRLYMTAGSKVRFGWTVPDNFTVPTMAVANGMLSGHLVTAR
jgi:hypothetical protein